MYYIALILTIVANVFYHISQKNISDKISPMFSLVITYFIALILSLIVAVTTQGTKIFKTEFSEINWTCISLGVSVVLLELGYLLAYRVGWNIGTAAIISTIIVTIALVPIGIALYKENISLQNIVGIVISLIGIYLINKKS